MRRRAGIATLVAAALAAGALAACGDSSQPGYCSDVSAFKASVGDLRDVDVSKGGISAITSATQKVETAGAELVSSAKSDFATETSTLKSSLTALKTTVSQLSNPDTAKAALRQLPVQVAVVANATKSLADATASKCS